MGGQNHQPTSNKRLIAPSAWLSQKLGEGFCAVMHANNHLEDAIIVAMARLHVEELAGHVAGSPTEHLSRTIEDLEVSFDKLDEIEAGYDNLIHAAAQEGYIGNPLASSVRTLNLAQLFSSKLLPLGVNQRAWDEVERRLADHNVIETLQWERGRFAELREPTRELITVIKTCRSIVDESGPDAFVSAVEHNEVALRQCYARVFSLWNHLHAMFLYSALMMTELFYRMSGYPSLLASQSARDVSIEATVADTVVM